MSKNFKWGTNPFDDTPVNIVLFVSRRKDNKNLKDFKERRRSFITHDTMDSEALHRGFMEFVYSGRPGEFCRCYYSVNERDPEAIHKAFLHYLIDTPNFNLCDVQPKLAAIANTPECRKSRRWLFDFDIDDKAKVDEFVEDLKKVDDTIKITVRRTVHGYGVVISHGIDTRTIYEKWDKELVGLKKDDLVLVEWATKE